MTVDEFAALCDQQGACRVCGVPDELNSDNVCMDCWPELRDEPPCGDPRPDPRTHPEYWTE